jgi:hypothetical protein
MEHVLVKEKEYYGEYVRWNQPTSNFDHLPPGHYLKEGDTFFVAHLIEGDAFPSDKHSYRNVTKTC